MTIKEKIIEILREPYFKGYKEDIQANYLLSLISNNLPKEKEVKEDTFTYSELKNGRYEAREHIAYNHCLQEIKELLNK